MNDLISRSALIEALENLRQRNPHLDARSRSQHNSEITSCFHRVMMQPTVDAVPVRDIEKAIDNIGVIARASNNTNFINGCTASLNEFYKALTPQKVDGKKVQE